MRGAEISTGEGGLGTTVNDAGAGLGKVEVAGGKRTGAVCPYLGGQQITMPPGAELGENHGQRVSKES